MAFGVPAQDLLCFCVSGVFACWAASPRKGGLNDAGHEGRKKVPAERCLPKGARRSAGKDGLEARGAGGEPHAGRALWPGRRRMCGKLAKTGHPVNGAADDARGVQHAGGACARLPDPGQGTWKAAFACAGPAGLRRDRQARSWSRTRLSWGRLSGWPGVRHGWVKTRQGAAGRGREGRPCLP